MKIPITLVYFRPIRPFILMFIPLFSPYVITPVPPLNIPCKLFLLRLSSSTSLIYVQELQVVLSIGGGPTDPTLDEELT